MRIELVLIAIILCSLAASVFVVHKLKTDAKFDEAVTMDMPYEEWKAQQQESAGRRLVMFSLLCLASYAFLIGAL